MQHRFPARIAHSRPTPEFASRGGTSFSSISKLGALGSRSQAMVAGAGARGGGRSEVLAFAQAVREGIAAHLLRRARLLLLATPLGLPSDVLGLAIISSARRAKATVSWASHSKWLARH